MSDAARISLSLVSHTNVGKTTLARTLLGRTIGEIRDAPHVTATADAHTMVETPEGDALALWDTPGFGDSVRLAKRLQQSGSPIGWFLAQVWDRWRDRPLWSSQQAVRNVRDHADVVLYLVNASEKTIEDAKEKTGIIALPWCGNKDCALKIENVLEGNTLGEPIENAECRAPCPVCGGPAKTWMRYAKSY